MLPDPKEFDRVAVPQPVMNKIIGAIYVFVARDIGEADIILFVLRLDRNLFAQDLDLCHHIPLPTSPTISPLHWKWQMNRFEFMDIISYKMRPLSSPFFDVPNSYVVG
jgi:hypothetical protein